MIPKRACAFVTFADREGAEKATAEVGGRFELEGKFMWLDWARAPPGAENVLDGQPQRQEETVSAEVQAGSTALFVPFYPSMDPRNIGNVIFEDPQLGKGDKGKGKGFADGKGKGKGPPPMLLGMPPMGGMPIMGGMGPGAVMGGPPP